MFVSPPDKIINFSKTSWLRQKWLQYSANQSNWDNQKQKFEEQLITQEEKIKIERQNSEQLERRNKTEQDKISQLEENIKHLSKINDELVTKIEVAKHQWELTSQEKRFERTNYCSFATRNS